MPQGHPHSRQAHRLGSRPSVRRERWSKEQDRGHGMTEPTSTRNITSRRKSHCKRGHEIAILGRYSNGACRACNRVDAMTADQLERHRAYDRVENMSPARLERKRYTDFLYDGTAMGMCRRERAI